MQNKIIDHEYKRVISKGIIIDLINEILGLFPLIERAMLNNKKEVVIAHERCFVATVESELEIYDKITMYAFAHQHCVDMNMERRYSKELRQEIHRWGMNLDKRIKILNDRYNSTGNEGLRRAYETTIKMQYESENPNYPIIDRALLLLKDMDKDGAK